MRIQNNITAMNTHRMYTINNDNVAKAAEKLSSGYRINRAGDDAAGLAISEKMRSQIRGLNMATKNSQDAISLVQTAEGALQETQNMLQRMSELAVQAATGTNEDFDRSALAKEFDQLKREINDVAEQTNFNNMKVLDGSLSYAGYVRSAATAGVTNTVATDTTAAANGPITSVTKTNGVDPFAGDLGGGDIDNLPDPAGLGGLEKNHSFSFKVTLEDGTVLKSDLKAVSGSGAMDATAFQGLGALKLYKGDTEVGKITVGAGTSSDNKITLASKDTAIAATTPAVNWKNAKIELIQHEGDGKEKSISIDADTSGLKATKPKVDAVKAKGCYEIDSTKVAYGDKFTVDGKTYQVVEKASDAEKGTTAVVWNGQTGETSDLVSKLATAIGTGGNVSAAVSVTGKLTNVLEITAGSDPVANGDAAIQNEQVKLTFGEKGKTYAGTTNTIEFDVAKMKNGDTFTINSSAGSPIKVTYKDGDTRKGFMDKVAGAIKEAGITNSNIAQVKGNALIIKDNKVNSIDLKSGALVETNAIRVQVGANEHEQLSVSIDAMNTAGLKLDDATLWSPGASTTENQDSAGAAITAVKAAINKVSDQRATLGAMQNRLDHKIANLKVSSENLSAAESRIRDVDMASEMTNFTKNNILSQAATAMLAQANALPQNVLSLLG